MKWLLIALPLLLGGCWAYERPLLIDNYYTRGDVDAINAEARCKSLARNLVQIEQCKTR